MQSRGASDPRVPRDSEGKQPWQLALTKAQRLSDMLHPRAQLELLFPPNTLSPVGVPTLSSLAATALRSHLSAVLVQQQQAEADAEAGAGAYSSSPACSALLPPGPAAGSEEGEASSCGICLEAVPRVRISGCKHPVCAGCALQLVQQLVKAPVPCPFCRTAIGGFEPCPAAAPRG